MSNPVDIPMPEAVTATQAMQKQIELRQRLVDFERDLAAVVNKHGIEAYAANTPDFVIAKLMVQALAVYTAAMVSTEMWYGNSARAAERERENNIIVPTIITP